MLQCNPTRTPVETTHKLDCSSPPILDRSFYCSFVVPFDILSLLSCILPLLARALPLRFNKYISLCMTHESLTSIHLSIFWTTSKGPCIKVYSFMIPPRQTFILILMLTGVDVQSLVGQPQAIVFFLEIISSLGRQTTRGHLYPEVEWIWLDLIVQMLTKLITVK